MNVSARFRGVVVVLLVLLLLGWWTVAADYSYGAVSGTYRLQSRAETSTLILKMDRSFEQELIYDGKTDRVQGTWRRIGEGRVVFSKEFLNLPGQERRGDGQAAGEVKKKYGIFLSIAFDPDPGGPVFRKNLFEL